MTTTFLLDDLRRDEGLRLSAYPDPLTHAQPWTIGYGHTGPEVHQGLVWTLSDAAAALERDVAAAVQTLDHRLPWWRRVNDARQDVLVNMAFNLGVAGLCGFRDMLAQLEANNPSAAADQMLASEWARQVGARARRLAQQLRTGQRPA